MYRAGKLALFSIVGGQQVEIGYIRQRKRKGRRGKTRKVRLEDLSRERGLSGSTEKERKRKGHSGRAVDEEVFQERVFPE